MIKPARPQYAPKAIVRRVPVALFALLASGALLGCTSSMEQTPPAIPDPAVAPAPTAPAAAPTAPAAAPTAPAATPANPAAPAAAPSSCAARIARVWHGRTTNEKAETYAAYISSALPKFRTIPGNLGYQLMRETVGAETHFMVISYWRSRDDIRAYAGDDIRKTRHLPRDAELLIDPEQIVMNYDLAVINLDCPR
ncbi:antibiotic biosynthesis monooxygenase family protein [Sorangium sp. So ce1151]|uniref:antibiotic biosynthesis monooxygenase family protein n=1 Tax=Sorangium sp. So ce1151 TaxID=3133332 RepID=UPI003F5E677B